jgi:hypothetical protein
MVAPLVNTEIRDAWPLAADESDAANQGHAPLRPSRYWLNEVSLVGFPGKAHADEVAQVMSNLASTLGSRIALRPTTISSGDPSDHTLRAAFGIQHVPALVICGPTPNPLASAVDPVFEAPAYCAIDNEDVVLDVERLTKQAKNLVRIFAAASTEEIESVLRTRRFRMLVWKAESRSGDTIDYITDLTARFGLGSESLLLAFDDRGWTTEGEPRHTVTSMVPDRPASERLADPAADGLDTWADDGGAASPRVDVQPSAMRETGKGPRSYRVVRKRPESARV